jgi:hypothetical protein
VSVP